MNDVRVAYDRQDRAWCGWDHFMGQSSDVCVVPVPTFGPAYVAVAKPKNWMGGSSLSPSNSCSMDRVQELSMPRFISAVMGAFLFSAAPQLSESTPFRLAGGSLGFAALSSIVVLFVLYRSFPHKKSFLVGSALFGSTVAAAMRFAFGTWLPSLQQIFNNPLVIGYTTLSALMGMALTYYYNDTSNVKINTLLRVALQLTGLGLLAASASSWEGSAAAVVAALLWRLVPLIVQEGSLLTALRRAKTAVQHDIHEGMPEVVLSPRGRSRVRTPRGVVAAAEEEEEQSFVEEEVEQIVVEEEGEQEEGEEEEEGRGRRVTITPVTPVGAPPAAPSPLAAALAAAVVTGGAVVGAAAALPPSPLVERGLILNVATGKTIAIGKMTYNKLTQKGYEVDLQAGTITPPAVRPRSSSSSGARSKSRSRSRRR